MLTRNEADALAAKLRAARERRFAKDCASSAVFRARVDVFLADLGYGDTDALTFLDDHGPRPGRAPSDVYRTVVRRFYATPHQARWHPRRLGRTP